MIHLGSEIYKFTDTFPYCDSFINHPSSERVDIFDVDKKLFYKFVDWFKLSIDNKMKDEFLSVYDINNNIGLSASKETIKELKNYTETKWRDVYTLTYSPESKNSGKQFIHFDFTEITCVISLTNKSEYDGGRLIFPRQDIQVELELGECVVFPGSINYPHYVEEVTRGFRKVLVGQSLTLQQDHKINY